MIQKSSSSPKIVIPEFGKDDLLFAAKYLENFPACLLMLVSALAWRAIITVSVKGQLEITQIASLPSQSFNASALFQKSQLINLIYAAVAVRRTANLEIQEYLALSSDEEKDEFIRDRIKNLAETNGKAQILSPRQISSPEDIIQHRRGLMSRFRGIHTTTCIYTPQNLFQKLTTPIQDLLYSQVADMYFELMNLLEVPIDKEVFVSDDTTLTEIYNETGEEHRPAAFFGLTLITMNPLWKDLTFSDGVTIANSGYPDRNNLPFENPLTETNNLKRGLPSKIGDIAIPEGSQNDPFVKAALSQGNTTRGKNQPKPSTSKKVESNSTEPEIDEKTVNTAQNSSSNPSIKPKQAAKTSVKPTGKPRVTPATAKPKEGKKNN